MKIIIAMDSFKESLSASRACFMVEQGLKSILGSKASYHPFPMADGGEGTADVLLQALGGSMIDCLAEDPLGRPINSSFALLKGGETAVVELARASGLELLSPQERNPLLTSTVGTGQLIKKALDQGAKKIILALGGSATNDGGAGMLWALGTLFFDSEGLLIKPCGGNLDAITRIDFSGIDHRLRLTSFTVACDVTNPLVGCDGASHTFARQKGASTEVVNILEEKMQHYALLLEQSMGYPVLTLPGGGAAGGVGVAALTVLNATFKKGIELIIEESHFEASLGDASLVITGEGSLDGQSVKGKTPIGIALLAKKYNLPVIALAGALGPNHKAIYDYGIDAAFSIMQRACPLQEALLEAEDNLFTTSQNVARLIVLLNK